MKYLKEQLKYIQHAKGFSLVETLVAITVLLIAFVGPMTIVAKGVFYSNYAKDQVAAYYLAQEAIEYIRLKRDNITVGEGDIGENSWAVFKAYDQLSVPDGIRDCLIDGQGNENGCTIDAVNSQIAACGTTCPALRRRSADGLFVQGGTGSVTPYTRTVKIYNEPITDPLSNELFIDVQIRWQNGTLTKTFNLRENILNWQ